ncbi:hypothetical protein QUF90_17930 [Desulfococcaceae bacterium HSG9]|nr:hypothetical protein [Desulfococcaceae bacterium HSG9]
MKPIHRLGTLNLQLFIIFLFVLPVLIISCAPTEIEEQDFGLVRTQTIRFECGKQLNQGLLLPVDIIYITRYHMPREVVSIGPNKWFNSLWREKWEERQTVSLKGGETRKIKLNELWLRNTKFLIIYADFKGVEEPYSQQIIIDKSGYRNENILVLPRSLVLDEEYGFWLWRWLFG